jgi:hypothetical protein
MLKSVGSAANAVVIVLFVVTIGAFSLIQIQGQPMFQIVRNVMLAALGEETQGLDIQGEPTGQTLKCDYKTGSCRWE